MSKVILKFDLSDIDDRQEYLRCVKANDITSVLWQFASNSKKSLLWEIENKETLDNEEVLELVFKKFYDLLKENNVNVDEIYS